MIIIIGLIVLVLSVVRVLPVMSMSKSEIRPLYLFVASLAGTTAMTCALLFTIQIPGSYEPWYLEKFVGYRGELFMGDWYISALSVILVFSLSFAIGALVEWSILLVYKLSRMPAAKIVLYTCAVNYIVLAVIAVLVMKGMN
jgi:hypothetical protein